MERDFGLCRPEQGRRCYPAGAAGDKANRDTDRQTEKEIPTDTQTDKRTARQPDRQTKEKVDTFISELSLLSKWYYAENSVFCKIDVIRVVLRVICWRKTLTDSHLFIRPRQT